MDLSNPNTKCFLFGALGCAATVLVASAAFEFFHPKCCSKKFSTPDQPARFAAAKANNDKRYLDITSVYQPDHVRGKVVVVTGMLDKFRSLE